MSEGVVTDARPSSRRRIDLILGAIDVCLAAFGAKPSEGPVVVDVEQAGGEGEQHEGHEDRRVEQEPAGDRP